jgi:hypothetical protein
MREKADRRGCVASIQLWAERARARDASRIDNALMGGTLMAGDP